MSAEKGRGIQKKLKAAVALVRDKAEIMGAHIYRLAVPLFVPRVMLVYCFLRQSYVYWVILIDTDNPSLLLMTRTASPRKMFWRKA